MDKPVTPEEELLDAVSALALTLEKMFEMLQILACEIIMAGGSLDPAASGREGALVLGTPRPVQHVRRSRRRPDRTQ